MPNLNGKIPRYRLHKASGQAIVTFNQTDHYLGPFGTDVSKAKYDRLLNEWLTRRRQTPPGQSGVMLTINHIIQQFWQHAEIYYRKPDGLPTTELDNQRQALRPLRRLYGQTLADDFGPKALKAIRQYMIDLGWCRTHINKQISRIKSVMRWAVENELINADVHHSLLAVRGLHRGRTTAREPERVRPVPEHHIQAIEPFVSRQVWALIQLQLLTAARSGELVRLRAIDLNTGGDIWTLDPEHHKTAHHGHAKHIYFGPQARQVLTSFLEDRAVDRFLFSPADAQQDRRKEGHALRKTPLSCGNRPGTSCRLNTESRVNDCYSVNSYRRAIERGCDLAFPPPKNLQRQKIDGAKKNNSRLETIAEWKLRVGVLAWRELDDWRNAHRWHPHQLRHNAGTRIRKEFGIEVSRVILGHRSAAVTEIYAELDEAAARTAMLKIG